ncbi:hypothetical protein ACHAXT_010930 [Thalassiosira profunda]
MAVGVLLPLVLLAGAIGRSGSGGSSLPTPINVLNLDRDEERWHRTSTELTSKGVPRRRIRRISAVYGRDLSPDELAANATRLARVFCTPGMIGCFLSHRKFWSEMVANGWHEQQAILEDDVLLCDGFCKKVDELVGALNRCEETRDTWDVLILGAFGSVHPEGERGIRDANAIAVGGQRRPRKVLTTKNNLLIHVPRRPFGTHAYVVSKRGARKLLQRAQLASGHVDCVIWGIGDLNLYCCDPQLAHPDATIHSTIGASSSRGLEALVPGGWKVDEYSGVTVRWALGEPLVRVPALDWVLTISRALTLTVLGALVGLSPRVPSFLLPLHLSFVAGLAVLLRIMSLPASSVKKVQLVMQSS